MKIEGEAAVDQAKLAAEADNINAVSTEFEFLLRFFAVISMELFNSSIRAWDQ